MRFSNDEFDHHEPCPKCGSRDNLGVWTDGHKYCFGCGFHVSGESSGIRNTSQNSRRKDTPSSSYGISLPSDCDLYIPISPSNWLTKFEITKQEIIANKILWSESRKLLCFPYFGEDTNLEAWQGRYFGDNKDHPKWMTYGKIQNYLKIFNLTNAKDHGIILVEDILSAIKVGRQYPVSPLFGSFADWTTLARYAHTTNKIIFWLDNDKYKAARKFESRASLLGFNTITIHTELDPKEYSNEEIKMFVENIQ